MSTSMRMTKQLACSVVLLLGPVENAEAQEAAAPQAVESASPGARPGWKVAGSASEYHPLLKTTFWGDASLQALISLSARAENVSAFGVDRYGNTQALGTAVSPRARAGLKFQGPKRWSPLAVSGEYEHDLPTGSLMGAGIAGQGMPGKEALTTQLRKAYARVSYGDSLHLAAGLMTSHFGLGLLSNDGANGWEPGSARFGDPRGGDRVLRGTLATGPYTDLGLVGSVSFDQVQDDDSLLLEGEELEQGVESDRANQVVGGLTVGTPAKNWAGLYVVHRRQSAADGRKLAVTGIDVAGTTKRRLGEAGTLSAGLEAALLTGEAGLVPNPTHPMQKVLQLGVAARAGLDLGGYGAALDCLYATGDTNLDDDMQNGFRADPNYELGLLLYRHVLASQTGHAPVTAGDRQLVGEPVQGLDRIPTRGSATNTIAAFPRFFYRPVDGLEVYGGPLLAWAEVPLVDPFNTRISGGSVRNALDGAPKGRYLGTELDVGVRLRLLLGGTELTAGLEGGYLMPGSAFEDAAGKGLSAIFGGRGLLAYRL